MSQLDSRQAEVYEEFSDYQAFESHERLNKKEMFDAQFMNFMKWFKNDIQSRYSRKDFQKMMLRNLIKLFVAFFAILLPLYIYLHSHYPQYAILWGIPLFGLSLYTLQGAEVIHMRTHSPSKLTGVGWADRIIDFFGLALAGISPTLFGRRHLAAHYNDIGNVSKLFSKVWLTFDKMPISYYSRPQTLIRFLLDAEFCREEKLDRKTLLVETISFYCYLIALVTELFFGSYFLLVFHLIPVLILASAQILSAVIVHSSTDNRNSFDSNGIFDYHTAKGLFKVPLWFFGLLNNGFFFNHGIHHAYPQVPLEIVNKEYKRYHEKILKDYSGVRYNEVVSHKIYARLLSQLPEPNLFDYFVTLVISIVALFAMTLTIMGLPIPPTIFEMLLVDYRLVRRFKRSERFSCLVDFGEQIQLEEKYSRAANPNTYLKWAYRGYQYIKGYIARNPLPPDSVLNKA